MKKALQFLKKNKNLLVKKISLAVGLLLFGTLMGIICAELLLRFLLAINMLSIDEKSIVDNPHVYSSKYMYINKPYGSRICTEIDEKDKSSTNFCRLNRYGFNDFDYPKEKPSTCRILTLGDSTTFGVELKLLDTWPKLIETRLNSQLKQTSTPYEVLNMGIVGYGPTEQVGLYKEVGSGFDANIVIVGFLHRNDIFDAYRFHNNYTFYFLRSIPDKVPYPINQWLKKHSKLWNLFLTKYYGSILKFDQKYSELIEKNNYQKFFTGEPSKTPAVSEGWNLTEQSFNELHMLGSKSGKKIIFLGLPAREQVDKYYQKEESQEDNKVYSDLSSKKTFEKICKKNGWNCLDLHEAMRAQPDSQSLFLKNDFHFNYKGNKVIENSLYQYLKTNPQLFKKDSSCRF